MKKNNKKGFTLAELLIVVAIIAVLVAIMIPVFGSALGKAHEAADVANVRAAYAERLVKQMTGEDTTAPTETGKTHVVTLDKGDAPNGSKIEYDKTNNMVKVGSLSFGVDDDVQVKVTGYAP